MNKKLTPQKALQNLTEYLTGDYRDCFEELSIIETALKEKETQDSVIKTLKEIIAFSQILPYIEPNKDNGFDIMSAVKINIQRDIENRERELLRQWVLDTCFPKELKALNIIKEKQVNIAALLELDSLQQYNDYCDMVGGCKKLTKQEYDLLKETLELWA